jgi:hypothetical protein
MRITVVAESQSVSSGTHRNNSNSIWASHRAGYRWTESTTIAGTQRKTADGRLASNKNGTGELAANDRLYLLTFLRAPVDVSDIKE